MNSIARPSQQNGMGFKPVTSISCRVQSWERTGPQGRLRYPKHAHRQIDVHTYTLTPIRNTQSCTQRCTFKHTWGCTHVHANKYYQIHRQNTNRNNLSIWFRLLISCPNVLCPYCISLCLCLLYNYHSHYMCFNVLFKWIYATDEIQCECNLMVCYYKKSRIIRIFFYVCHHIPSHFVSLPDHISKVDNLFSALCLVFFFPHALAHYVNITYQGIFSLDDKIYRKKIHISKIIAL